MGNIGYDLLAITIIDEMEVRCPTEGCSWRGKNRELEEHCDVYTHTHRKEGEISIAELRSDMLEKDLYEAEELAKNELDL